jgi:biopolymer transport protein TolR
MSMAVGDGGGGGGRGGRFAARGEINVTPLIDIVLVLLIVFMVMTPVMLKQLLAKIPQEQSDNTPQPPADNPIVISLAADGTIALGSEPVALEALAGAVAERIAHDRQKVVFFHIDDHARYGRAVKLMDLCKGAGASTLGIVTNK